MSTTGPRIKECLDRVIDTFSRPCSESDARGMFGISVGGPVAPLRCWLLVKLEVDGAPDEILRDIGSTAQSRAPMSSALRSSIDVPVELQLDASARL